MRGFAPRQLCSCKIIIINNKLAVCNSSAGWHKNCNYDRREHDEESPIENSLRPLGRTRRSGVRRGQERPRCRVRRRQALVRDGGPDASGFPGRKGGHPGPARGRDSCLRGDLQDPARDHCRPGHPDFPLCSRRAEDGRPGLARRRIVRPIVSDARLRQQRGRLAGQGPGRERLRGGFHDRTRSERRRTRTERRRGLGPWGRLQGGGSRRRLCLSEVRPARSAPEGHPMRAEDVPAVRHGHGQGMNRIVIRRDQNA